MEQAYIDSRKAAKLIGLAAATLATLRSRGGGPRFVKAGKRVLYSVDELHEWMRARVFVSTNVRSE